MPAICRDENKLGDKDWAVLEAFGDILQSFEDAVKALEGDGIQRKRKQGYFESCGNVWDVIVGYEFLLAELEKAKAMVDQYPEPEHFKVNINLGWKKLDEYYNKLDETPIYYTSLALHPLIAGVISRRCGLDVRRGFPRRKMWYNLFGTEDTRHWKFLQRIMASQPRSVSGHSTILLLSDIRTKLGYVLAKKWTLTTQ
ncbi:unnamed protein product, partial [Fusarium langsethiae]